MKKCGECGAIQNNKHFYCIDCNERLGPPLTKEEEKKERDSLNKLINNLSNKADYFYVSKADKTIVYLLCIFSVLHALLMLIRAEYYSDNFLFVFGFIFIILALSAAFNLRFPRISWKLNTLRYYFIFKNLDDLEPSEYTLWSRRFFPKLILAIVAIAFIVMLILSFK